MPFRAIQPSALGSAWDYDIIWEDPWTNWTGTRTWAQMFDDIRADTGYGTDIVDRIGSSYFVYKRLRFVGITILEPLLESSIICRNTGLIAFHAGCDIQFGTAVIVAGEEAPNRGCLILEDIGSGSRANDNFNKNTRIVMDSTLRLYDTVFQRVNATRSDFDWSADSLIVMRNVTLQMRGNHFNHFYGKLDIDGLVVQTQSGSSIEFRTAAEDFIKFDNVFPYRLDLNENQRVLVLFVPSGAPNFATTYTFVGYKGVNFARWSLGADRSVDLINPYFTNLESVGGNSGRSGHGFEKRTVRIDVKDLDGDSVEGAQVQIQHRLGGPDISSPAFLLDGNFPYDVAEATDATGVVNALVNRFYWEHNSARVNIGGVSQEQHVKHTLTPHIMRIYKYGKLPVEQPLDVTPPSKGAGGFSLSYSMGVDPYITLSKADALLLGSSINVETHASPVTWEGLQWDCTMTTDLAASQIYQWIRAVQDEGIKCSGDYMPTLMPEVGRVVRSIHNRALKAFRIIRPNGDPAIGILSMESKDGTPFIPPEQYTLTLEGFAPGSDVVVYDASVPASGSGANVIETFDEVAGSSVSYPYIFAPNVVVHIGVFKVGYVPLMLRNITLSAANTTLPINQIQDRNYAP